MELWNSVVGAEGFYEVSNVGRVRSITRMVLVGFGCKRLHVGRVLKQFARQGYLVVNLSVEGIKWSIETHRLVLEAFTGLPPMYHEACHGNGIRSDNRIENLRWDTRAANMRDMDAHGKRCKGEASPNAKLTEELVRMIRSSDESSAEISLRVGVSPEAISKARRRFTWKHVA